MLSGFDYGRFGDPEPRIRWVPIEWLSNVDMSYQRNLRPTMVRQLAADYNTTAANVCHVSIRDDGTLWLIDGQTRVAAALKTGQRKVLCFLLSGLTPAEEADLFIRLSKHRSPLPAKATIKAEIKAGYQIPMEINQIAEDCGCYLDLKQGSNHNAQGIDAVSALKSVYSWGHAPLLRKTLTLIRKVWPADVDAKRGDFIKGVGWFLKLYPEVSIEELAVKLVKYPVVAIWHEASALHLRVAKKGQKLSYISMAILERYNFMRRNKLEDRHFGRESA